MKNTAIVIVVLVLVVLGVVFYMGKGGKVEAPVTDPNLMKVNDDKATSSGVNTYTPPATAVKEFTVTGKNFSFTPSEITVNKGDKVKIIFKNTEGFHDFKIDAFGAATKQAQSPATEVLEFTADQTGSFEYYCSVGTHRQMGMKGTLTVK